METEEYDKMAALEEKHWWYMGLHNMVFSFLEKFTKEPNYTLDAGCGTGCLLKKIGGNSVGIDFSEKALSHAAKKIDQPLINADIRDLPFQSEVFDTVISCDVIDCLKSEEAHSGFQELSRVLKKNGVLILNLPAYQWLRSEHDRAVHVVHRYNKAELKKHLLDSGFSVSFISYRNSLLFPIALLVRLLRKKGVESENPVSDVKLPGKITNRILTLILNFENKFLKFGIPFPFGLSLCAVAVKNE